jgi:YegS/Rv2252/BmrU family lipid kinase
MRKGLLLYNPAAGRFSVRPFVRGILRPLRLAGWHVEIAEIMSGSHATHVARQAAEEKYDAVFAIGGDGTVGQVASGLIHTETALAVLPAGTMNVWALELGQQAFDWLHYGALQRNARLLANASVHRVDVGLCNDQPFLLWAGIGLDAMTIHQLEPRPRFAKYVSVPQYVAATFWTAASWRGMDLRVWADDQRVDGHFLLAVATNIRRYVGGLAVLSPNAYIDDGEMDLWLISGSSMADAFRAYFDLLAGLHLTSDQARRLPFHSARIESDTAFSVHMDGEPMLGGKKVAIVIQKQALKVIIPPNGLKLLASPGANTDVGKEKDV